ncbi:MAG: sensor histidine kinase [Ilumatobacteraceae bacterium]
MRSGAASDHVGYFHETAVYGSDDELLDIVLPFLRGGLDAGEPVVVTFAEHNAALAKRALGRQTDQIRFVSGADQYARPATTIRNYRDMFAEFVAEGAQQIRVVGDVPHTGTGFDWHDWVRYEAAINRAYDDFPLWGLCPYDTRLAPADVLDHVARTHPHVATADGRHHRNPHFEDPAEFWHRLECPPHHDRSPDIALIEPTMREARQCFATAARDAGLSVDEQEAVALAVSELVTNAIEHGSPPVLVEGWVQQGRVEIAVVDGGNGPSAPFTGLVPASGRAGGRGLWIVNQICDSVILDRSGDRFVARAVVGSDPSASQ